MENSIKINKHYYWIDLLRFTSAFLVMLVHFRGMFFVEYRLLPESNHNIIIQIFYLFTRFGKEPVIVFFVLSGFLVGGKSIQQILNNDIHIKSYFIDRSVRIFLPLIASSLLLILIQLLINSPIPFVDIVGSFFSVQGIFVSTTHNPPLWSLSYEVWFYLMMGCIMTISITKKGNSKSMFSFLILSLCMLVFMKLNPLYLFIWFMGAFAYLLPRENIAYKKIKIPLLIILLCVSFILSQSVSDSRSIKFVLVNFLDANNTSIFLAFITCLLIHHLITAAPQKRFAKKIEKIGTKLADFSYSLYLTHYPLMSLLAYYGFPKSEQVNSRSVCLYIIELLIGLGTAYLIYLVSEKHTYKIKKMLKNKS